MKPIGIWIVDVLSIFPQVTQFLFLMVRGEYIKPKDPKERNEKEGQRKAISALHKSAFQQKQKTKNTTKAQNTKGYSRSALLANKSSSSTNSLSESICQIFKMWM